jgi:hypothetical protein
MFEGYVGITLGVGVGVGVGDGEGLTEPTTQVVDAV